MSVSSRDGGRYSKYHAVYRAGVLGAGMVAGILNTMQGVLGAGMVAGVLNIVQGVLVAGMVAGVLNTMQYIEQKH